MDQTNLNVSANSPKTTPTSEHPSVPFGVGSTVVYGTHGKCKVLAIEEKAVGNHSIPVYKLEIIKTSPGKSHRTEAAIWVPIHQAQAKGLRAPLNTESLKTLVDPILASGEFYFPLHENWQALLPKLEKTIQTEGLSGLAKAHSFLFVLKRRLSIVPNEVNKFADLVQRLLFREISDLTEETYKEIETRLVKTMKAKLSADQ